LQSSDSREDSPVAVKDKGANELIPRPRQFFDFHSTLAVGRPDEKLHCVSVCSVLRVVSVLKTGADNERPIVTGRLKQGTKALPNVTTSIDGYGDAYGLSDRVDWQYGDREEKCDSGSVHGDVLRNRVVLEVWAEDILSFCKGVAETFM